MLRVLTEGGYHAGYTYTTNVVADLHELMGMPVILITTRREDSTDREAESLSGARSQFETAFIPPRVSRQCSLAEYLSFAPQKRALSQWARDESLRAVREFVWENIAAVPEVVRVIGNVHEDFIGVCTIIDSPDSTARYRVYEIERKMLVAFPRLSFDFRVVNLRNFAGASITALSTVEGEILYNKLSMVSDDEVRYSFSELPRDVSYAYA